MSGRASAVEESRNEVAVASARIALEQARGDLAAARRNLAAMWGARQPDFGSAVGDLERVAKPGPFRNYVRLLSAYPSLARWPAETNRRVATVAGKGTRGADVTLTVGPRWWEGPQAAAIFANVSVPLPANRNQGAVRQAQAMVEKAAGERKAAAAREAGNPTKQVVKAHTEIRSKFCPPNAQRTADSVRATQLESSLRTSSKHAARLSRRAHSICKLL
jgi:cobalt-zinc-cadmium efflux system outer membrane protein